MTEPSTPSDRERFRWDPDQDQPHNFLSKWQKLWGSRADVAAFASLVGCNARHLLPILRRYRQVLDRPVAPREVAANELGVAISPSAATWGRHEERLGELGVRSVLLRVPVWDREPVLSLADRMAAWRAAGVAFTFVLVQDREAVVRPARWAAFARDAVARLAHLEPTFQVVQALNRKKWGIWLPGEYLRLLEGVAPARAAAPGCRFVGPPVIDFEYHFTVNVLYRPRPFDFDGVSSLLYVDRRGSPEATQYRHFDLRRKILLLQAVLEASPHPPVPLVLTEFNWPLRGAGRFSPAGRGVQVDEAAQARYLVLYYLAAAATGYVATSFWWQLQAPGYGLLPEGEPAAPRPAYRALARLLAELPGWRISRLPARLEPLRGYLLERGGAVKAVVHGPGGGCRLARPAAVEQARSTLGAAADPRQLVVGPDPCFLDLGRVEPDAALEALRPVP